MKSVILSLFLCVIVVPTHAQLAFQFKSPAFTGIGYSSHVQTIENTERTRRDAIDSAKLQAAKDAAAEAKNTNLQKFLNNFESRVYAQLSSQMVNNLFGENPQSSGQVTVGDNTIKYFKTDSDINLMVTSSDGSVTEIIIPVGQFKF
jgi:hypothetical protein